MRRSTRNSELYYRPGTRRAVIYAKQCGHEVVAGVTRHLISDNTPTDRGWQEHLQRYDLLSIHTARQDTARRPSCVTSASGGVNAIITLNLFRLSIQLTSSDVTQLDGRVVSGGVN